MRILFENGQVADLTGGHLTIGQYTYRMQEHSTPVPGARFWYRLPGGAQRYIASKIKEVRK